MWVEFSQTPTPQTPHSQPLSASCTVARVIPEPGGEQTDIVHRNSSKHSHKINELRDTRLQKTAHCQVAPMLVGYSHSLGSIPPLAQ